MIRADLFTTIHTAVRRFLFDAAIEAARVDLAKTCAVDALNDQIEHVLGLLEEHAAHEDAEVIPVIRTFAPAVAVELAAAHDELEAVQREVARASRTLALAAPNERVLRGEELLRAVNVLTAKHLLHMNYEETVGNAVLVGALGDSEIKAIRAHFRSE